MDYTSQHGEVKMAPNPAYEEVAAITAKTESHYEEVAAITAKPGSHYEEVGPPTAADDHGN